MQAVELQDPPLRLVQVMTSAGAMSEAANKASKTMGFQDWNGLDNFIEVQSQLLRRFPVRGEKQSPLKNAAKRRLLSSPAIRIHG